MSGKQDISKSDAFDMLVGLGATLAAAERVTAAALMLVGKVPAWWSKRVGARAEVWWTEFLKACSRDNLGLEEMRTTIAAQMENNPQTADVIMGHMRDVLDTVTNEAVGILGSLRGAYYAEHREIDGFFRSTTELLMQCTASDLAALRDLTARISCIAPRTKSCTLAVNTRFDSNTGARFQNVADVELDSTPSTRQDILAATWEVGALWKRLQHLLVSTGLARNDNDLYGFIVEHDDMRRLHHLVRQRGISDGKYRYFRRGRDNLHVAELESLPYCFGYGTTSEEALESLRSNLALFADDAATAELIKTPRP